MDVPPADLAYRIALHRIPRLSSKRFVLLDAAFPDAEAIWRHPAATCSRLASTVPLSPPCCVAASGLDTIYPPENRHLADEIVEHGALIFDYLLGTKPRTDFFPRHNRIMSGIALGTLLVEGNTTAAR